MITDKQKEWLEGVVTGTIKKSDNPHKYSIYMRRIKDHMNKSEGNLRWMIEHTPELIADEEAELTNPKLERHRRLKTFLMAIKA